MYRIISTASILLLTVCFYSVIAGNIKPAVLTFDMNACQSVAANGTNSDYSELTALPANNGAVRLSADHIYRQNPMVNPHSCTPGLNGTNAICIAVNPFCDYLPGSSEALRFDVLVEPLIGESIRVEELNFQQKAPLMFDWVDGNTALNNYPTLYGIRILANNQVIYEEHNIPTTRDWNLETINFHANSNFLVVAPTVFSFELLPYCAAGVVGFYSIWDLEDISVSAACVNDCSEVVNGGQVFLMDGTYTYYACEGDAEFQVQNNSTLNPEDFDYLITDENFNVIRVSESSADLNLSDYTAGTYFVFGFSGDGTTLIGSNISQITNGGCIELTSNSVTVLINKPNGGVITGGPFTFCQNNQSTSYIPADAISLTGEIGANARWVITDATGENIISVPPHPSDVDFSNFGLGTCLIYHVTFDGWLKGLEAGGQFSTLESGSEISSTCYSRSNPIMVTKKEITAPTLSGGPIIFCVGDGAMDRISNADVTFTTGSGLMNQWVLTNGMTISAIANNLSDFEFDNSELGYCNLWNITYDNLTGLEIGEDLSNVSGCYARSNSVMISKTESVAGMISGGPFEFCVGDNQADYLPADGITLAGNVGTGQWIVTDQNRNITHLPTGSYNEVNFDLTSEGSCNIVHLSYQGVVTGLMIGGSIDNLYGCYGLSNLITITKNDCTPLEGGTISGGPFSFCTSDGQADVMNNVSIMGTTGTMNQWVLTTQDGIITELLNTPDQKNFEGTAPGVCILRNISYEAGIQGLTVGNNINTDLVGKHGLSNSLSISKSQAIGGSITGGPFTFCVGDEENDNIPAGAIALTGNTGGQSAWIATDAAGSMILAVSDNPESFDFENAGDGNCWLYHISYDSNLSGLVAGADISALDGCYSLSNNILIIRDYVSGGELESDLGYFEFCIGDGIPDFIPADAINLVNNIGDNQYWVITNTSGTEILEIPTSPYNVDFDGSDPGTCVLWSVSSTGPMLGLVVGGNFLALDGCHSKSNFISIFRYQNTPGLITGGPFTFCVGDSVADIIQESDINLSGNTGANSQWIITDNNGMITDLPVDNLNEINFDEADAGTAMLYHLSYDGPISGLGDNMPLANLDGCLSLSNGLTITKENCPRPASRLVINEVNPDGIIEIKNTTEASMALDNYWLVSYDNKTELSQLQVACGESGTLTGNETVFLKVDFDISAISSELALSYEVDGTEKEILQYVVWGGNNSTMTDLAIAEGLWMDGEMIDVIPAGKVLVYDGEGIRSSDWKIVDDSACKISSNEKLSSNYNLEVFPNPANESLNVSLSNLLDSRIELVSRLGEILVSKQVSAQQETIELEGLQAGMYFIRVVHKESTITKSFIKL